MNEGQDRSFYVTMLSSNNAQEFPNNNAARFKARLPFPLPDNQKAWEVGLVGLFVPAQKAPSRVAWSNDSLQNLGKGFRPTPCCFICSPPWRRVNSAKPCRTMCPRSKSTTYFASLMRKRGWNGCIA